MSIVNRTDRLNCCLEQLHQGGGDATFAAVRAERLILELSRESSSGLERRWKTHKGESRIDGCRKFYIGRRFRLICIRKEQQILFVFAGTHDECDRWIEYNRRRDFSTLSAAAASECEATLPAVALADISHLEMSEPGPETDYESYLRKRVSEREIHSFFTELFARKN